MNQADMLRALSRLVVLGCLVMAGAWAYWFANELRGPAVRIEKLEAEKRELERIVQRLTDEQRVAEILVTDVRPAGADGSAGETSLIFMEYARDGRALAPKSFVVRGDKVYVAGLSIRFRDDFVMKNDPLRGRGIMLFTKLFGEDQTPASGAAIDSPGHVPDVYRGSEAEKAAVSAFEKELWGSFWRLVEDKTYREAKGVEVAGGKAVWFKAQTDRLYRITVDARGSATVDWEAVKPIYREAMKKAGAVGSAVE